MKVLLIVIIIFSQGVALANNNACRIDKIVMVVSHDLGHGGRREQYQIVHTKDRYEMTLIISRIFPTPGENDFKPWEKVLHIKKTSEEINIFIKRLTKEFNLFELASKKNKVFLHPTFYDFEISDSCGKAHKVKYIIEGNHHISEKYKRLINEIVSFYEN